MTLFAQYLRVKILISDLLSLNCNYCIGLLPHASYGLSEIKNCIECFFF